MSKIADRLRSFPFYKQFDGKDCGPTCLKIISAYYKQHLSIQDLRNLSKKNDEASYFILRCQNYWRFDTEDE